MKSAPLDNEHVDVATKIPKVQTSKPESPPFQPSGDSTRLARHLATSTTENSTTIKWRSRWLGRSFLLALVVLLIILIIALGVLLYFSKHQRGLPLRTSNHFSWTYGPTAVLTIFVAVWRQMDYNSKILTPWHELTNGSATYDRSLGLDYISPLQVVSFARAVKARHAIVVATIAGFVSLKLAVLASTGLLSPRMTTLAAADVALTRTSQLNGHLYNSSLFQGLFDQSLAYTAYAVMSKGLPYASSTTADLVYESTIMTSSAGNASFTAQVNALIPKYHCELAPFDILLQPDDTLDLHPQHRIELLLGGCSLRGAGNGTAIYALNPLTTVCPERQLSPLLQQIDCKRPGLSDTENWQLLTLVDLRYSQSFANETASQLETSALRAQSWSTQVERSTGIACRSSYSIRKVEVTYSSTERLPAVRFSNHEKRIEAKLEGFTDFDLGVLTTSALSASATMFGNFIDNEVVLEYPNVLFKMMAAASGGSYDSLFLADEIIEAAQHVFQQVALQSTSKYLLQPDNSILTGSMSISEERLHITDGSAVIMLVGLFLVLLLTCFLSLKAPSLALRDSPDTIGKIALVVSQSKQFRSFLRQVYLGNDRRVQNSEVLHFGISNPRGDDEAEKLAVSESARLLPEPRRIDDEEQIPVLWWSQFSFHRWVLFITLAFPLVIIAALEILQHQSDREQGFATLKTSNDFLSAFYTRYLPAIVMLLIATLINMLDFNVVLLNPFQALLLFRERYRSRSLVTNFMGLSPPFMLFEALRVRQWAVVLSTVSALLAGTLTIAVSGLYIIDTFSLRQQASFVRMDQFNTSWINSGTNDSSAAVLSSLTESLGLEYPPFTYEEYVIPSLELETDLVGDHESNAHVNFELVGLRGDLGCVRLAQDSMNISASFNARIKTATTSVFARMELPAECLLGGPFGNESYIDFTTTFSMRENSSFVGKLLGLHVGPFDQVTQSSSGELAPNTQPDNPPGCPSLAFVYGYADVNDDSQTSITSLMCYQYIDELNLSVDLTYPNLEFQPDRPPSVNESSSRRLTSGSNGETAFQFRLQTHMDDEFSSFNQTADNSTTTAGSAPPLDNFFQGVLFGRQPLDPSLLSSKRSEDVSTVYAGIRGLYRRYLAQAMSANMRVAITNPTLHGRQVLADESGLESSDSSGNVIRGDVSNLTFIRRVVQNRTTKIILQSFLGTIFVLSSCSLYLSRFRKLVPYNPCCIAGVASLFAWSRMCDLDDEIGRQVMRNKGEGLGNGKWKFRLGWWDATGPQPCQGPGRWYGIDAQEIRGTGDRASQQQQTHGEILPAWI